LEIFFGLDDIFSWYSVPCVANICVYDLCLISLRLNLSEADDCLEMILPEFL